MRPRPVIALALLAAVGALAVAGCGGDDDESTTAAAEGATGVSGAALTDDEFVEQGNAICNAGDKEIEQSAEGLFGGQQPSEADLDQFATDVLVPSVQGQIDAIRALTPPEESAEDVTAFLDDAESALDEIEADPSLVAASDDESPFADVNVQADEIGLTACAG
jgi:hypothetical protein